jgi:hypothetical protein
LKPSPTQISQEHWAQGLMSDDVTEPQTVTKVNETYSTHVTEQLRQRLQQRESEMTVLQVSDCQQLRIQQMYSQEDVSRLQTSRDQLSSQLTTARRQLDDVQTKIEENSELRMVYKVIYNNNLRFTIC